MDVLWGYKKLPCDKLTALGFLFYFIQMRICIREQGGGEETDRVQGHLVMWL